MMDLPETRHVTVEDSAMTVMVGTRPTDRGEGTEYVCTVPGTEIMVSGPSEDAALEAVAGEIRAHVAAARSQREGDEAEEARRRTVEGDGKPAQVVMDGKTGGAKSNNTTKEEREAEQRRLFDVPLEELARTLALLEQEAEPHKARKAVEENALNKITQRKKNVIAELERRGKLVIERDLGKGEFEMR